MSAALAKRPAAAAAKVKLVAPKLASAGTEPTILFAKDAVEGVRYTGWQANTVLWWTGSVVELAGMRFWAMQGISDLGDSHADFNVSPYYPLLVWPAVEAKVTAEFVRRVGVSKRSGAKVVEKSASKKKSAERVESDGDEVVE